MRSDLLQYSAHSAPCREALLPGGAEKTLRGLYEAQVVSYRRISTITGKLFYFETEI